MRKLTYIRNTTTLKLNTDTCNGCGLCITVCPHGVFEMKEKKSVIINKDACMECGACAQNCPVSAIDVRSGVGCATGIIQGIMKGTEPTRDCSDGSKKSCC